MRYSKFNIKVIDTPEKGKTAVYNTITQALAILENSILENVEKGSLHTFTVGERDSLMDNGILVPDDMDENLLFDTVYNQLRLNSRAIKIAIINTLSCNFACSYCYEGDLKSNKKKMSFEMVDNVISWIKDRILENMASEVHISFHGGEPLLNIPAIDRIASELKDFCKIKNVKFYCSMISNGYLLNKKNALKLVEAGIQFVRVSIDGPEYVHDSLRFRKGGGGTYKTIINNLVECKDILPIGISGNFTKENAQTIPDLLDELMAVGLGPESIKYAQFYPVMPINTTGKGVIFDGNCIPVEGYHEEYNLIQQELSKRGYKTLNEPKITPCPVVHVTDFTINYDGTIYKCPCLIDQPNYSVGHVTADFRYNTEMVKCLSYNIVDNETCRNCSVLPLCIGGCRYLAFVKNGVFHNIYCQRETIENVAQETVRQQVREHMRGMAGLENCND